jgi:hypothetical protein
MYIEKMLICPNIDLKNNGSVINFNGTYYQAQENASFDYLAVQIPIISSRNIGK